MKTILALVFSGISCKYSITVFSNLWFLRILNLVMTLVVKQLSVQPVQRCMYRTRNLCTKHLDFEGLVQTMLFYVVTPFLIFYYLFQTSAFDVKRIKVLKVLKSFIRTFFLLFCLLLQLWYHSMDYWLSTTVLSLDRLLHRYRVSQRRLLNVSFSQRRKDYQIL